MLRSRSCRPLTPDVTVLLVPSFLTALLSAQAAPSPLPQAAPATNRVFVEAAVDGTAWVRGSDWKAAFTARGIEFVPFLGADAPRNFPVRLEVEGSRDSDAPRIVGERRIEITRRECIERYDLAPAHVEQSFVFAQRPAGDSLVVRMRVQSELAFTVNDNGSLAFANERGGVRYGRAIVFDATGRRSDVGSVFDGATLTLTVPVDFTRAATFPLTIDPIIQTFTTSPGIGSGFSLLDADCAYLGTWNGLYAAVHEEAFSATDHDVYVTTWDRDGNVGPATYVDYTTSYWAAPRIASHRGASQFLVVAAKGMPALNTRTIDGRTLTWDGAGTLTTSPQFSISNLGTGRSPDVGGDPNPSPPAPGNYCVTWEAPNGAGYWYNIVHTDGSLLAANGVWQNPAPFQSVSSVRVGKSCGVGAYTTREWVVVMQKQSLAANTDILGARLGIDGNVITTSFPIDSSPAKETNPEVSSITDPIEGNECFVVVYQRTIPGSIAAPQNEDVIAQVFTGTTSLSGPVNMSDLLLTDPIGDQYDPCVDTDGYRFTIGFTEDPAILGTDTVANLATVHVHAGAFNYTELPAALSSYSGPDGHVRVTSERSGGTFTPRYMATWDQTSNATGLSSVHGAFWAGHLAAGRTSYFALQSFGCGSLTITPSGLPALGSVFQIDVGNASGIPVVMFGDDLAAPAALCGTCVLGVDPNAFIFLTIATLSVYVPQDTTLIGTSWGAQGMDVFAPNGCAVPFDFTLSDMILVTLL
ncbi:MAG: hypothetical protein JNK78_05905 [Planctomycetes bacterium]|nr:hypothetical protein [Planctomycetota bacterium]